MSINAKNFEPIDESRYFYLEGKRETAERSYFANRSSRSRGFTLLQISRDSRSLHRAPRNLRLKMKKTCRKRDSSFNENLSATWLHFGISLSRRLGSPPSSTHDAIVTGAYAKIGTAAGERDWRTNRGFELKTRSMTHLATHFTSFRISRL